MPTPALSTRLSLGCRMLVSLLLLSIVSALVLLTAVSVTGLVAWLAILSVTLVLALLFDPLASNPEFIFTTTLAQPVPIAAVCGLLSLPHLYLGPVRNDIQEFRTELGTTGSRASERHPEVADIAQRLAQQADIATPEVYIVTRSRPESYALGGRSSGSILLTRGLIRSLSDDELTAVIAHEISHLANGDSRMMGLALVPLLVAEDLKPEVFSTYLEASEDAEAFEKTLVLLNIVTYYIPAIAVWLFLTIATTVLQLCSQLGLSVLSRGREFAADSSAVQLTGSPGALASALRTLDDARGRPTEDKRTWKRSASALDILPPEQSKWSWSPFRTHPSTDARVKRLEALVE